MGSNPNPYKKRRLEHQGHMHRGKTRKRGKQEGSHPQSKKRSRRKPILLAPRSYTSSLQNHEKITFCYISHPVYAVYIYFLWQPEQILQFKRLQYYRTMEMKRRAL